MRNVNKIWDSTESETVLEMVGTLFFCLFAVDGVILGDSALQ